MGPPRLPPPHLLALYTFLKVVVLGYLIYSSFRSLLCDCALNKIGSQIANGTNLLVRSVGPHYGFNFPYGTQIALFVMRNKYKLAILN